MGFIKEENIGKISLMTSVILVIFLTGILGGVFLNEKYQSFKKNMTLVEKIYINFQRERLKSEISIEIDRINSKRKSTDNEQQLNLKRQVSQAHRLVANLYQKFSLQNQNHIETSIKKSIRPIWINSEGGNFFIWSNKNPRVVLFPDDYSVEGSHVLMYQDTRKNTFENKLQSILAEKKEGYISFLWPMTKNGQTELSLFKAYIKLFEPMDWIIGVGDYAENLDAQIKEQVIRDLSFIHDDSNQKEYVFVYKVHNMLGGKKFASMLVNPNRPDLVGTAVSDDFKDAKGNLFRKEMIEKIRTEQEAFVKYWYKKPDTDGVFPKLSYFKYFPDWKWIVAKGSYLDELEIRIKEMQSQMELEIKRTITFLAIFLLITCLIFLTLAFFFSRGVGILFEGYKKIQRRHRRKLEELNKTLKRQATTDPLTQIHNRAFFNSRMKEEISRAQRYNNTLGLILFDIDHFKRVNDTYGHLEGDNVLKVISHLSLDNIRSSDVLARWGGEEFVILVPEEKKENAKGLAEKLRIIFENHKFDRGFQVTCSFGVTHLVKDESQESFINRADHALYQSKENGRNQVTEAS